MKKNQREVKESDSPFLPHEIILNILKRLPVKSLIRFKCVCKHWQSLIKSPSFIDEHLQHSTHQNTCLLIPGRSLALAYDDGDILELRVLTNDMQMQVAELDCANVADLLYGARLVGYSNGLLCYYRYRNRSHPIVLWNPATRDVRLLVPEPTDCDQIRADYKFGFNPIINDYKVVSLFRDCNGRYKANVYSLETGMWKEVESSLLNGVSFEYVAPLVFNGSIFWLGYKRGECEVLMLVSFDMAMEVFALIPSLVTGYGSGLSSLTIHENKLAIFSHTYNGNRELTSINLWVMEDATDMSGERFGWTMKFSFSHSFPLYGVTFWRNKMICVRSHGDGRVIFLVNLTTSEVTMFDMLKYGRTSELMIHVESLVPVN